MNNKATLIAAALGAAVALVAVLNVNGYQATQRGANEISDIFDRSTSNIDRLLEEGK